MESTTAIDCNKYPRLSAISESDPFKVEKNIKRHCNVGKVLSRNVIVGMVFAQFHILPDLKLMFADDWGRCVFLFPATICLPAGFWQLNDFIPDLVHGIATAKLCVPNEPPSVIWIKGDLALAIDLIEVGEKGVTAHDIGAIHSFCIIIAIFRFSRTWNFDVAVDSMEQQVIVFFSLVIHTDTVLTRRLLPILIGQCPAQKRAQVFCGKSESLFTSILHIWTVPCIISKFHLAAAPSSSITAITHPDPSPTSTIHPCIIQVSVMSQITLTKFDPFRS